MRPDEWERALGEERKKKAKSVALLHYEVGKGYGKGKTVNNMIRMNADDEDETELAVYVLDGYNQAIPKVSKLGVQYRVSDG